MWLSSHDKNDDVAWVLILYGFVALVALHDVGVAWWHDTNVDMASDSPVGVT